jgi:hypothetical protein
MMLSGVNQYLADLVAVLELASVEQELAGANMGAAGVGGWSEIVSSETWFD